MVGSWVYLRGLLGTDGQETEANQGVDPWGNVDRFWPFVGAILDIEWGFEESDFFDEGSPVVDVEGIGGDGLRLEDIDGVVVIEDGVCVSGVDADLGVVWDVRLFVEVASHEDESFWELFVCLYAECFKADGIWSVLGVSGERGETDG